MGTGTSWLKDGHHKEAFKAYDTAWRVLEACTVQEVNKAQRLRLIELRTQAAIKLKQLQTARACLQVLTFQADADVEQPRATTDLLFSTALACIDDDEVQFAREVLAFIPTDRIASDLKPQVTRSKAWCLSQLGHPNDALALIDSLHVEALSSHLIVQAHCQDSRYLSPRVQRRGNCRVNVV